MLLIGCISFLYAEESEERYSISELEAIALQQNPEIKLAYKNWRAAVSAIAAARSLPDPTFSFTEFIEEVQTRLGPQKRSFSITQMIPWFGTLDLRIDSAYLKSEILLQKIERQKWNVIKDLKMSLVDIIFLNKKIEISKKHLIALDDLEASIKGKLQTGQGQLSSVLRIQVEKERLKDGIQTMIAMNVPYRQKLERSVGKSLDKNLPLSYPDYGKLPGRDHLFNLFYKLNPEWNESLKAIDNAKVTVELAKKKKYPDFGVGFSYIDIGSTSMQDSGQDAMGVMVSFTLPIWRQKINSNISSSQEQLEASQEMETSIKNRFKEQLEMVVYKIEDAERKVQLYRDSLLVKADDAYQSSKNANDTGSSAFQNVLDAERVLLQMTIEYENALADQANALALLESLVGKI